jgi:hypothetical protein
VKRRRVVLVGLSLALLLAAWTMATRPFAAPDEASHYLRALDIANGTLVGPKVPYFPPAYSAAQHAWVQRETRGVIVSPALSPPGVNCEDGLPDNGPRPCLEATTVGTYHPLPYLLPALALKASNTASTGLWLSRAGSALVCLAFLVLAAVLLWDGSAWSLLGLLMAITPMVLFTSSVVNPNGLEIASSIAFAAAVFRIARSPARVSTAVWVATAVSGATVILAWQLGPLFVAAGLALLATLLGSAGIRALFRGGGAGLKLSAFVLGLALALWCAYGIASGAAHFSVAVTPFGANLHAGLGQLGPVLRDAVGTFGSLSLPLPSAVRWLWWLLVIGLVVVALILGSRRERVIVAATILAALLFPVLFYAWVYRLTGFGMQGRYVLPALVLIPLVAGEVVRANAGSIRSHLAGPALSASLVAVAAIQGYAWWYSASYFAGAPTTLRFYAHATWTPPLGWPPWIAAAALGVLALIAFAAPSARPAAEPVRSAYP